MESRRKVAVGVLVVALVVLAGALAMYLGNRPYVDAVTMYMDRGFDSGAAPWADPALAEARGEAAARRDLQNGVRQFVIYGLLRNTEQIDDKWRGFGYTWRSGGCRIGGDEYSYMNAYNRVMLEAGRKEFGERFPGDVWSIDIPPGFRTLPPKLDLAFSY